MRRPRNFWAWTLTITSALLAVVWVGSMRWTGRVMCPPRYVLGGSAGRLLFVRFDAAWISEVSDPRGSFTGRWDLRWWFVRERCLGMAQGTDFTIWQIPLWPFVLLTGVPGVWMLVRKRRRTNPNACPACGYDLTGLPTGGGGACPECGASRVGGTIC